MTQDLIAGRYRLLEPLGHGAMSSVWLAEDEDLGRRVAVKTLGENADRARFEREARAAAALSHPNICQLYDYGEVDGRPYMVLEHLPGGTLEDRLVGATPLADTEVQSLAEQLATGLAHAHERGLVHRDLKPVNILFDTEGRPKIADFGIARMGGSGTLTEAGTVLGTASYISPEQAGGLPATPASDVYSFGVILFRMLTGRLPYVSKNAMELVRRHRDDPPPLVSEVRPDAPPRLADIADGALAKDPLQRPPDGAALLAELRGLDAGQLTTVLAPVTGGAAASTEASAATQIVRPARARRRRRRFVPLLAGLAALLLLGVVLAVALTGGDDSSPPPATSGTTTGLSLPAVPPGKTVSPATTTTSEQTTVTTPTTKSTPTTTSAPSTTATTAATTAPATTPRVTTNQPAPTTAPVTSVPATTAAATTALPPPTTSSLPTTTTAPTDPVTTAPTTTAAPTSAP